LTEINIYFTFDCGVIQRCTQLPVELRILLELTFCAELDDKLWFRAICFIHLSSIKHHSM